MAHVEIDTYLFQVAFRDIHVMLHEVVRSHVLLFKNLVVQSYFQMQSSLMDQLHKHEFTSLLVDVPSDVVRARLHSCVGLASRAWLLSCPHSPSF
jgi:hypothetical protein